MCLDSVTRNSQTLETNIVCLFIYAAHRDAASALEGSSGSGGKGGGVGEAEGSREHSNEGAGPSREGDGRGPLMQRRAEQLAARQHLNATQANVASGRGEQRRRARAAANRGRGPGLGRAVEPDEQHEGRKRRIPVDDDEEEDDEDGGESISDYILQMPCLQCRGE